MEMRASILEIPRLLRETLEKGADEYESLVRKIRWGDGPLFMGCCGASSPAGLAGTYLFESLAGLPVVSRPARVFEEYTQFSLRPRSVLMVIAPSGEDPEALDLVRLARGRGALPLALTRDASGRLAGACAGVFLTRDEGAEDSLAAAICRQAALSLIAFMLARVVKGAGAGGEAFEDELKQLPGQIEWCFTHLADAIRSLVHELQVAGRLWLVGGGLYHPTVARGVGCFDGGEGICAQGIEASEFCARPPCLARRGDVVLLVSGSRLRFKRQVHRAAAQVKAVGARVISLTDSNDRELIERSDIAILGPQLSEWAGAILALALLGLLGAEWGRNRERNTAAKLPAKHPSEPGSRAKV